MSSISKFDVAQAIAALHCQATHVEETDWAQIVRLYEVLERLQPSPSVTLNLAVAIAFGNSEARAMADSPQAAFGLMDGLAPELDNCHLFHATRADSLRRIGALEESSQSYTRALELVTNDSERRFLECRLHEVSRSMSRF